MLGRCSCPCPTDRATPSATGEALAVIAGVERKVITSSWTCPTDGWLPAYPGETTEAFLDGHVSAFAFLGGVPRASCTTIRRGGEAIWGTVVANAPGLSASSSP